MSVRRGKGKGDKVERERVERGQLEA